nr:RNA-directed DNA polymerase, eukaryota, reverse transcriptase zinc-binding domain protein [Tanacetum cinerariifolium]
FGDSYKAPTNTDPVNTTRKDAEQSRRTVTLTTDDMQKKKNDVKARTTLLLSLPDEHQLRFSKYKTAKELWTAILKTFGGVGLAKIDVSILLTSASTPIVSSELVDTPIFNNSRVLEEVVNSMDKSSSESINNEIKLKEGGSILEILEEMITVGQTMGFSMEGCTKNMEKIIETQGEQVVF